MEAGSDAAAPEGTEPHDHAWSRIDGGQDRGLFGEYHCDICDVAWSL
jgi:hypothetical protein